MSRTVLLVALLLASAAPASAAQVRKFPYEAAITQNETYVRSGPGTRYYPTSRLNQGAKVMVHRHDPGGWYMIAPPPGSFSWIRAEYVDTADGRTGTLKENHVVVRVGTEFGDTRDVEQKRLSRGDQVAILGEKTFSTEQGEIRMFRIAPPRGEYRWVPGQAVAPLDAVAKQQHDKNPYNVPSEIKAAPGPAERRPDPFADPAPAVATPEPAETETPTPAVQPGDAVVQTLDPEVTRSEAERLAALDEQFRLIVRRETAEWDFAGIETGYRQLQQEASSPGLEHQLEQRFAALQKYQKIKDQFDDFVRLTRETADRDAQLLKMSRFDQIPSDVAQPQPTPATGTPPRGTPTPAGPAPQQPRGAGAAPQRPQLAGAGVVQRLAGRTRALPGYVLVAPNGRVLAYLESTGNVDLAQHVGHAVGVVGDRRFRTDLQADVIQVDGVVPVRLKQ